MKMATNHNHPGSGTVVFVTIFRLLRNLTKVISITKLESRDWHASAGKRTRASTVRRENSSKELFEQHIYIYWEHLHMSL